MGTLLLYIGDLRLGFFAVDDPEYVVNNPWVRGFSFANVRHILTSTHAANYSPLHLLSYSLDHAAAGLNPYAFHLSNNLWAGLGAGFVSLVALALTRHHVVALAAGVLFLLHPAHVEAIAWISSRKDLVATAFALPSFLAYLRYREGGSAARRWYVASLVLFLLALAGKMSVATFPAVFIAHDLFVERRMLSRSILDKAPYFLSAGLIALVVVSAQPSMGNRPDPYVLAAALTQNVWLLSGLGTHAIYRVPPDPAPGVALQLGAVLLLVAVMAAPLLLRRRAPRVVVLLYWLLFAMIPAQVLSFSHPVTDRYLFFPSVAFVTLVAWGLVSSGRRLGRAGALSAGVVLLAIALVWGRATLRYLAEWSDPRSVWHAASSKSLDPAVTQNLGSHYQQLARGLSSTAQDRQLSDADARRLAAVVWADDPRLPSLLSEWSEGALAGPVEQEFREELLRLAWDALERSLRLKGNRVLPGLFYNRGLVLMDRGDLEGARRELEATLDEVSRENYTPVRQRLTVYSHMGFGVIAWKAGDYAEALRWFQLAEQEQERFGGHWVPDISAHRQRLEAIVGPSKPN